MVILVIGLIHITLCLSYFNSFNCIKKYREPSWRHAKEAADPNAEWVREKEKIGNEVEVATCGWNRSIQEEGWLGWEEMLEGLMRG